MENHGLTIYQSEDLIRTLPSFRFIWMTFLSADGVMVQITAETMDSLRQALRDMKDFTITCGKADQEENQEQVHIQWTEDDHNFNKG